MPTTNDSFLQKVRRLSPTPQDSVVYGQYDNARKPFLVRLNDFLIDHSRVSLREKSNFFHMLAVMVDAGIPVVVALKSLALRSQNQRFQRVLSTIAHNCEQGTPLASAMSRFDDIFDASEIGVVRSGEAIGQLHHMLFRLSDQIEKRSSLRAKLVGAAVYPVVVLVVLVFVVTAMLVWVFPTLLSLLEQSGVGKEALPLPTRVLMFAQEALVGYWWAILAILALLYGIFVMYRATAYGALNTDYFILRLPLVGALVRKVHVLRLVSMLGLLIESGLTVLSALQITAQSLSNRVYQMKLYEVQRSVQEGGKISEGLSDTPFLVPAEVVQMVGMSERSASLGKVSGKIAAQYDREIDESLKRITSIFEPLMIVVVGLFVALIAMAIMAPIFNLSNNLSL